MSLKYLLIYYAVVQITYNESGNPLLPGRTITSKTKEIYAAVIAGQADKLDILLQGYNADSVINGRPLIYTAVEKGDERVVLTLLKHGANPNIKFNDRTLLYWSLHFDFPNLTEILLDRGADPTIAAGARRLAIENGHDVLTFMLVDVDSQTWFIDRLQVLFSDNKPEGVCFAISMMALHALAANIIKPGQFALFEQRLDLIRNTPKLQLKQKLEQAEDKRLRIVQEVKEPYQQQLRALRKKIALYKAQLSCSLFGRYKNANALKQAQEEERRLDSAVQTRIDRRINREMSPEEILLLDIRPFFTMIKIYQQDELFSQLPAHNAKLWLVRCLYLMKLLMPALLEEQGGIVNFRNFSGIYRKDGLMRYFRDFRRAVVDQGAGGDAPVILQLIGSDHAILVYYDISNKNWILININDYDVVREVRKNEEDLAGRVMLALFAKNDKTEVVPFSTHVYTIASRLAEAKSIAAKWLGTPEMQRLHEVTRARFEMKSSKGRRWLDEVNLGGNPETVTKLNAYLPGPSVRESIRDYEKQLVGGVCAALAASLLINLICHMKDDGRCTPAILGSLHLIFTVICVSLGIASKRNSSNRSLTARARELQDYVREEEKSAEKSQGSARRLM